MGLANLIMLGIAVVALAIGAAILLKRGGTDAAKAARRIAGTMVAALGIFLAIFAIGLSGTPKELVR